MADSGGLAEFVADFGGLLADWLADSGGLADFGGLADLAVLWRT